MTCLASRVRGEALETAGLAPGPWVLPLRHQKPDLRAFRGEGMVPGKGFEPLTFGLQNRDAMPGGREKFRCSGHCSAMPGNRRSVCTRGAPERKRLAGARESPARSPGRALRRRAG